MRLLRRVEGRRIGRLFWVGLGGVSGALLLITSGVRGQEARDLYLEVYINDISTGLIGRFTEPAPGQLTADAGELCRIGLKPGPGSCRDGTEVTLPQGDGLSWQMDEPAQVLRVTASDAVRAARVIEATGGTDAAEERGRDRPVAGFGAVLNYDLGGDWAQAGSGIAGNDPRLSGLFDARLYAPLGVFHSGFSAAEDSAGTFSSYRLESYWRSSWAGTAVQLQMGDVITRGPDWSRSVRLGGVLVQRNFDLRPDLVTLALPSYAGSAAVPSTVDVYSSSLRRYTTEVPAGPFVLSDLPLATGSGEARVVVRDSTGRETEVNLPFLVSSDLLRPGLVDFALAYGRPRLGIGTETDRYLDDSYGVGSLRVGLSNRLTLSLHGEYGAGLRLAGIGGSLGVGHLGTLSMGLAGSRSDKGDGELAELSGRFRLGRLSVSGRRLETQGAFYDVARFTADSSAGGTGGTGADLRRLSQLSLSMPLGGRGSGLNLFYADTERAGGEKDSSLGASVSRQLRGGQTLNLTGVAVDGAEGEDIALGVSLHVPLGRRRATGGRIERRDGRSRQLAYLSGQAPRDAPGWDWRLQLAQSDDPELQARAARDFRHARLDLAAHLLGEEVSLGARAQGAVVLGGGGLFLSRRVDDAFAVVDAGAPGVEVRHENRVVGTTGRSGRLLVPVLRAWQDNSLSIDAGTLPLNATVGVTKQTVRPAGQSGSRVDFGVDTSAETALVSLVLADGSPVPVGLSAELAGGSGAPTLVGYDGQVFLSGLLPGQENTVIVHFMDNTECRARFAYDRDPEGIAQIEGVACL